MFEKSLITDAAILSLPSEKGSAIRAAVDAMSGSLKLDSEVIFKAVMDREKIMSTGMGHGVAIPHAKVKGIKNFALSISRSDDPIDYGALDSTPVRILALLLSPEDQVKEHVRMIADITKRLKFSQVRQAILDSKSAAELASAFLQAK